MADERDRILIVEDDDAIASGLSLNLKLEGYAPTVVGDGVEALEQLHALRPALVLLDINLPKTSGLEFLQELRAHGDATPIIVLSARQGEFDKVAALRLGADDYVTKPFGVAELLARIDAILRRSQRSAGPAPTDAMVRFGEIEVDGATRRVRRAGVEVSLTHLEFELLWFLVQNPERVFRREELLREVWGENRVGSGRTVDNFIAQLRAKLEDDPNEPRHVATVRGSGYRFVPV